MKATIFATYNHPDTAFDTFEQLYRKTVIITNKTYEIGDTFSVFVETKGVIKGEAIDTKFSFRKVIDPFWKYILENAVASYWAFHVLGIAAKEENDIENNNKYNVVDLVEFDPEYFEEPKNPEPIKHD